MTFDIKIFRWPGWCIALTLILILTLNPNLITITTAVPVEKMHCYSLKQNGVVMPFQIRIFTWPEWCIALTLILILTLNPNPITITPAVPVQKAALLLSQTEWRCDAISDQNLQIAGMMHSPNPKPNANHNPKTRMMNIIQKRFSIIPNFVSAVGEKAVPPFAQLTL